MKTIIETRQLRRVFKSHEGEVEAVAGVDLEVDTGEIFGFLGPNGAGKTTTLRMLATLLPPTSGQATVAGYDLRRESAAVRRSIGYVGQSGGTDPDVSGRSELLFQAQLYGMARADALNRTNELLGLMELENAGDRPTGTYSGGMKRRLDVALGLVHSPPLLFLDEPTTGLDPQSRARMWKEIRALRERGTTVFLVTHYLEEADVLCDRLAIIDGGRIVALGTPIELKHQIAGDIVTIGVLGDTAPMLDLLRSQEYVHEASADEGTATVRVYVSGGDLVMPAILRLIDSAGLQIETIALSRPTLDDVFLRKTGHPLRETSA